LARQRDLEADAGDLFEAAVTEQEEVEDEPFVVVWEVDRSIARGMRLVPA
jgi:hypothetical protein